MIHVNNSNDGPYSAEQISELLSNGDITFETLISKQGTDKQTTVQALSKELNLPKPKQPPPRPNRQSLPPLDVTAPANMHFYILNDKEKTGPYSIRDVFNRINTPEITADSKFWKPGMTSWQPFSAIKDDILNVITNR